jgi:hypothetical protein
MSNTSMGEGLNVPVPTGGSFYSQICNFPEESFILSSPCNSAEQLPPKPVCTIGLIFDMNEEYNYTTYISDIAIIL